MAGGNHIRSFGKEDMEIERKFLIKEMPDLSQYGYHDIEQVYVLTEPVIRARKKDDRYILTVKGQGMMAREEFELPLSKDAYDKLKLKAEGVVITKRRFLIPYDKYTIELDIFGGSLTGLNMAEVEFESVKEADDFKMPDWFLKDVTDDISYHNSNMSRGIIPTCLRDNE